MTQDKIKLPIQIAKLHKFTVDIRLLFINVQLSPVHIAVIIFKVKIIFK